MKRPFLFLILGLVVVLVITLLLNRESKTPPDMAAAFTLRVPEVKFMGLLPLYVADEQGFYREEDIHVEWLPINSPREAGQLFFAGQADLIMSTFASMLPAEIRSPGQLTLLVPAYESMNQPGSYLLVRPDSDVKAASDLKGRSVGTYQGPSQRAYAVLCMTGLGLTEGRDYQLVEVSSANQLQAFFGGSFEALFTVETYASTAILQGAKVIESQLRPRFIQNPFWVGSIALSKAAVAQQPGLKEALERAMEKSVRFIAQNETEARGILVLRMGTDRPVAERCGLYTWVPHPSEENLRQIQENVDLLVKDGVFEHSIEVAPLFE